MTAAPRSGYDFALLPSLRTSLHLVGKEREPVLVVDGLLVEPEALVDYAAAEVAFHAEGGREDGYPGVRAPAPLNYVEKLVRGLSPLIERAFALEGVKLARAECNLSMVTRSGDNLAPFQRIPHVDTVDPLQFAFLHYLCDARFGGTAFYRHRATGFEAITPERLAAYEAARAREVAEEPPAAGYIVASTRHYEQTAAFEAKFDRLLIYRSRVLHSGQIRSELPLSADPRAGRLTANIFVNYRRLAS
ncbi:MAG: DUF6445 family protein [Pseudomonadota bacterium]|nr:DUF6445 family protein [Pseudomonadota bacterium]